ncbi:MAG: AzlD domain-containing protein [Actinobacteria bacterium]|nr:AzlD domain-containing protein [Actinomycetota bacterium]
MTPAAVAVVVAAGLGTFLIRASFLAFADRMAAVPANVKTVLRMIPAAALAALTAPALLRPDGHWDVLGPTAVAGLAAAVVAFRFRSILASLVVGFAILIGLQQLLG